MNNGNSFIHPDAPSHHEPIAIVGMSCRFPKAHTLQKFWELLIQGKDTITEISPDRWDMSAYYDPDPQASRKSHQRHAALLENIHDFDPLFFSISPAEATEMSPSQKLMLELVWEAIENSTIPFKKIQGQKAGVYIGNIWNDFEHLRKHKFAPVTSHSAIGQSSNIIANRISFAFGLTGPSLVLDTGCSSSLVALHLACQSLWDNSSEIAFAGAVNHILDPDQYILLSKFGGLSPKGKCSTFDQAADGFVRGEGAGILLLKTLSQAEKDGNKIYALIRGSAVNNNGHNVNLPATSVAGQKQVLEDAYAKSGIAPDNVHYVEAHGTGTRLGDPTETKALGEFFGHNRHTGKLHIGSVKTNIGHLEAAAGIAGLIKVVLAMEHRTLPPSLNFNTPNPDIPFEELKLQVQKDPGPWPTHKGETLKAGINSFGWGGTNAHTVLEEYRPTTPAPVKEPHLTTRYCLPLSARSPQALKEYAIAYLNRIRNASEDVFQEICQATAILKPTFDHRVLLSAIDKEAMLQTLEDFIHDTNEVLPCHSTNDNINLVMIFPGQGSQWIGMGRELLDKEPVFRQAIQDCDLAFRPYTDWSLIEQLKADASKSRLDEIDVIQPALCAMQIALARLWMSWGIKPHSVVGHSMGEVAAAYISEALTLEDAARIICTRSKLMKTVSGQGGTMAVTELSLDEASELVTRYPELSVAVNNSPKSTVLAGDQKAIQAVLAELESQERFCRQVKVDVASHSRQMIPLTEALHDALANITPRATARQLYSTVKSRLIDGQELNASYWTDNLCHTVQFAAVMKALAQDGHTVFIEVSPHPVLTTAMNECVSTLNHKATIVASLYREKPEQESIFKNLAELYTGGYTIDWNQFYPITHIPAVQLPAYPFQRERYEIEDKSHESENRKSNARFPLLGNRIPLADQDDLCFWETQLSLEAFPYINDHKINDTPFLPGTAYAEMILEAMDELYPNSITVVSHLHFIKSVAMQGEEKPVLQVKVSRQSGLHLFQFFRKVTGASEKPGWELIVEGEARTSPKALVPNLSTTKDPITSVLPGPSFYKSIQSLGLHYGSYFQGLKILGTSAYSPEEVHFNLTVDDRIKQSGSHYVIHPALLDACLQPLFYKSVQETEVSHERTTFLTEVGEIQMYAKPEYGDMHGTARFHPVERDEQRGLTHVTADISIQLENGTPLLEINGLKGTIIDTTFTDQVKEKLKDWLYKVSWIKQEKKPASMPLRTNDQQTWIILGDPYGFNSILSDKMERQGIHCIRVTHAGEFRQVGKDHYTIRYDQGRDYGELIKTLVGEVNTKITGILHVAAIRSNYNEPALSASELEAQQMYGSLSLLHTVQQLDALKLPAMPRLVIVTNGIQPVGGVHEQLQPIHSPMWGLTRVLFNELSQHLYSYVDVGVDPSAEELDALVNGLQETGSSENVVAIRGLDRYVPRLNRHIDDRIGLPQPEKFSPAGTYVVTGYRSIGFSFIEWMIKQGARNFALISRTGKASPGMLERIAELETQGCWFKFFRTDVGNYKDLEAVMHEIDTSMPQLMGIVHAAGVIEATPLAELDTETFLQILKPKVNGAWNLHLLTRNRPLKCFIMFSSASTLIGLSGLGSYVAANAFLDALAHYRMRSGLPGMSVNWGVIKDVGMTVNDPSLEKYAQAEGFEAVSMDDALEVFNMIYERNHTQIGIVKLRAETMAEYYSALGQTPYFMGLLQHEHKDNAKEGELSDHLLALSSPEEKTKVLEQFVIRQVAKIVKTSSTRIRPTMTFKSLGIDSLMAIQLRNLLEKGLNLKLSATMFATYPSIREYTLMINDLLAQQTPSEKAGRELNVTNAGSYIPASQWFLLPDPVPNATMRLFCFHDAGGNASLYHSWTTTLHKKIELVMVELPGRGERASEKPYTDLTDLVRDLKPALLPLLDKPYMFFGHSMGGLVVFELTRALRKEKAPLPTRLFISSTPGLTSYSKQEVDHTLNDDELIAIFPHLHIAHTGDWELQQQLLNLMRADLHLINKYRYEKQEPLNIPLIALHGSADLRVRKDQAERWKEETAATFKLFTRPGGHRYIEHDHRFVTALILREATIAPVLID